MTPAIFTVFYHSFSKAASNSNLWSNADFTLYTQTLFAWHQQPSPCIAGKSASSELESQLNKDSESCLQAISSGTQSVSAELAMTSKIPHREKEPLASRCKFFLGYNLCCRLYSQHTTGQFLTIFRYIYYTFVTQLFFFIFFFQYNKVLPAKDRNDHRSERVKHKGLKGSTRGQASKQTQSRDILKSNSKMKLLFNNTNVEDVIHPKAETTFAFLASTDTVPHVPTCDIGSPYSESEEEEEADYDPSSSFQGTFRAAAHPWQVSRSSSAFSCFSHSSHLSTSTVSPVGRHGYHLGPFLERTRQPHAASLLSTTDKLNQGFVGYVSSTQRTHQHLHKFQSSWPSIASSYRTVGFCSAMFAEKQSYCTTDFKSKSSNESCHLSASGQVDDLNVDDMTTCGDIKEQVPSQECQEAWEGATAAQNAQSLKDSSKEIVCRPKQRW